MRQFREDASYTGTVSFERSEPEVPSFSELTDAFQTKIDVSRTTFDTTKDLRAKIDAHKAKIDDFRRSFDADIAANKARLDIISAHDLARRHTAEVYEPPDAYNLLALSRWHLETVPEDKKEITKLVCRVVFRCYKAKAERMEDGREKRELEETLKKVEKDFG